MIIKSIIFFSIVLNAFGVSSASNKFDNALRKQEFGDSLAAQAISPSYYLPELVALCKNTKYLCGQIHASRS